MQESVKDPLFRKWDLGFAVSASGLQCQARMCETEIGTLKVRSLGLELLRGAPFLPPGFARLRSGRVGQIRLVLGRKDFPVRGVKRGLGYGRTWATSMSDLEWDLAFSPVSALRPTSV